MFCLIYHAFFHIRLHNVRMFYFQANSYVGLRLDKHNHLHQQTHFWYIWTHCILYMWKERCIAYSHPLVLCSNKRKCNSCLRRKWISILQTHTHRTKETNNELYMFLSVIDLPGQFSVSEQSVSSLYSPEQFFPPFVAEVLSLFLVFLHLPHVRNFGFVTHLLSHCDQFPHFSHLQSLLTPLSKHKKLL